MVAEHHLELWVVRTACQGHLVGLAVIIKINVKVREGRRTDCWLGLGLVI